MRTKRNGLRLLDKQYKEFLSNLGNEDIVSERIDTYSEIIDDVVDTLGNTAFDEIKYRVTDGENINEVLIDSLTKLDNNGYNNKLIRDLKFFMDLDWLKYYCNI